MGRLLNMAVGILALGAASGYAGDAPKEDAYAAAKAAEIELLRARLAAAPTAGGTATLFEAEELLRRLRQAPPHGRDSARAQLDAAIARLNAELSTAERFGR